MSRRVLTLELGIDEGDLDLRAALRAAETAVVRRALAEHRTRRDQARALGVSLRGLYYAIRRVGLDAPGRPGYLPLEGPGMAFEGTSV